MAKVVEDLVVLADEVLQREAREGMQTAHNCFGAALTAHKEAPLAHKEAPVLQVTLCVIVHVERYVAPMWVRSCLRAIRSYRGDCAGGGRDLVSCANLSVLARDQGGLAAV